jgi:hypothetical protein
MVHQAQSLGEWVFGVLREVLLKVLRVVQDLRGRFVPPP